jgi:hypothetical protein
MTDSAEQTAYMRRAADALVRLFYLQAEEQLPVLAWSVNTGGCGLTAHAEHRDMTERLAAYQAWVQLLGSEHREAVTRDGERSHIAESRDRTDSLVRIVITARIWEESSSDED